jgi:hypothetical protein
MERAVELGLCVPMQTSWSPQGSGDEGLRGLVENLLDTRGAPAPQVRARLDFWLDRHPRLAPRLLARGRARPPPPARRRAGRRAPAARRRRGHRPRLDAPPRAALARRRAVEPRRGALPPRGAARPEARVGRLRHRHRAQRRGPRSRGLRGRWPPPLGTERVRLDPLDLEATKRLVRGLLDVDDPLCDLLAARAEGNPLFVTQLLHQLVVAEAVERRARPLPARAGLRSLHHPRRHPRRVEAPRRPIRGRRARPRRARARARSRLARGRRGAEPPARLRAASSSPSPRALSSGLLRVEGGAYVWAHGLLRAHLVDSLDPGARRVLHAVAAAALSPAHRSRGRAGRARPAPPPREATLRGRVPAR